MITPRKFTDEDCAALEKAINGFGLEMRSINVKNAPPSQGGGLLYISLMLDPVIVEEPAEHGA